MSGVSKWYDFICRIMDISVKVVKAKCKIMDLILFLFDVIYYIFQCNSVIVFNVPG
jgi:hypothetical protein